MKRQFVLLGVFVILLGALAYDFLWARPAVHQAYLAVNALVEKQAKTAVGKDLIGPAEVRQTVGRAHSSKRTEGTSTIETYEWRAGMPLRTYKLYVVYAGIERPFLAQAFENEEPSKADLGFVERVDFDKAAKLESEPTSIAPGGAGGGGGGGGGGRKKRAENDEPPQGEPDAARSSEPEAPAEKTDPAASPNDPSPSAPDANPASPEKSPAAAPPSEV
ncbi:MAG: hypothetical protein FJ295_15010 [Planctomycetes bacterium]|nr:hypothetical protein [Planctomycetota bacterium]